MNEANLIQGIPPLNSYGTNADENVANHFPQVEKLVEIGCSAFREQLPPAEDVKKVERRLAKEDKKSLKKK